MVMQETIMQTWTSSINLQKNFQYTKKYNGHIKMVTISLTAMLTRR